MAYVPHPPFDPRELLERAHRARDDAQLEQQRSLNARSRSLETRVAAEHAREHRLILAGLPVGPEVRAPVRVERRLSTNNGPVVEQSTDSDGGRTPSALGGYEEKG